MSDNILFDNFLITDDKLTADQWAGESWEIKNSEEAAGSLTVGDHQTMLFSGAQQLIDESRGCGFDVPPERWLSYSLEQFSVLSESVAVGTRETELLCMCDYDTVQIN